MKVARAALGVIGNIAFPSSSKKGKLISPPSPQVKFTRSLPVLHAVAQGLSPNKDSQSDWRVSHPSLIKLIFT